MIFFRIGCYLSILTGCLHLIGHFRGMVPQNDTEKQLLDLMANYKVQIGSDTITMEGLQEGFSLCFSLLFIWSGVLSLVLSYKLNTLPGTLRTVSLINTAALAIGTSISLIYFFSIPTTCFVLCLLAFAIGSWRLSDKKS